MITNVPENPKIMIAAKERKKSYIINNLYKTLLCDLQDIKKVDTEEIIKTKIKTAIDEMLNEDSIENIVKLFYDREKKLESNISFRHNISFRQIPDYVTLKDLPEYDKKIIIFLSITTIINNTLNELVANNGLLQNDIISPNNQLPPDNISASQNNTAVSVNTTPLIKQQEILSPRPPTKPRSKRNRSNRIKLSSLQR